MKIYPLVTVAWLLISWIPYWHMLQQKYLHSYFSLILFFRQPLAIRSLFCYFLLCFSSLLFFNYKYDCMFTKDCLYILCNKNKKQQNWSLTDSVINACSLTRQWQSRYVQGCMKDVNILRTSRIVWQSRRHKISWNTWWKT